MQDTPLCGRHRNGQGELADSRSYLANSAQRADRDPTRSLAAVRFPAGQFRNTQITYRYFTGSRTAP